MSEHSKTNENPAPMGPPPLPENWTEMTGDEKYQYLSTQWASAEGKSFASSEVAEKYERRAQRWLDVIALKKPDQVPEISLPGEFALEHAGNKAVDTFYHPEKATNAFLKYHEEFESTYLTMGFSMCGKALDTLGYKLVRWAGSSMPWGVADHIQHQYVEDEYMVAEDYDQLIANPDGYMLRKYIPIVCNNLKGLEMMPSFFNIIEIPFVAPLLLPMGAGPLREALDKLLKAADQMSAHMQHYFEATGKIQSRFGTPNILGGFSKAPFDFIGDTMRGTRGMMMDMYRRPEKVLAACEALVPHGIELGVQSSMATRVPFVFMPLHKGADGFMSREQFETFYWPTFKAVMLGLIDNGLIPLPFVEGSYNSRLDTISASGLPAGKTAWLFDRTDMKAAKEKIGDFACIGGNVPASLFTAGTTEMMDDYCKNLLETVGSDGGFFLAPGSIVDQAKPENVSSFLNSVRKFGKYKE